MRIRNIKPGFWTNEHLSTLPHSQRLFFIGLWMVADRSGRLEDRPERLRVQIFPYELRFDARSALDALVAAGFLIRYEVDGSKLLEIPNFEKHQYINNRERESELPGLDQGKVSTITTDKDSGQQIRTTDNTKSSRVTTRGSRVPMGFKAFWEEYPKKVGKKACLAAWTRQKLDPIADQIVEAVKSQKTSDQWKRGYVPNPLTFINQGRWEDEVSNASESWKDF